MATPKNTTRALAAMAATPTSRIADMLTGSGYQSFEGQASKDTYNGLLSAGTRAALYGSASTTSKNEVYDVMDAYFINMLNTARARDLTAEYDVMDYYYEEYEYTARRLAMYPLKGTNPKFKGITRQGVNQQAFRVPGMAERQLTPNWNYQNFASWQAYQIKKAVDGRFGIGRLYSGMLQNMLEDRNLTFTRAFREVINQDINATTNPLKASQKITVTGAAKDATTGDYTPEYAANTIKAIQGLIAEMQAEDTSARWNNDPNGFSTVQDIGRLRLLIRPQLLAAINRLPSTIQYYESAAWNLPVKPIPWANFGGLTAYAPAQGDTTPAAKLYPVYAADSAAAPGGEQIGWSTTEGAAVATVFNPHYDDTNAAVDWILYDRSRYSFISHNQLTLAPAPFNVAGMYVTHWLNEAEGILASDWIFNLVVGMHAASQDTHPDLG